MFISSKDPNIMNLAAFNSDRQSWEVIKAMADYTITLCRQNNGEIMTDEIIRGAAKLIVHLQALLTYYDISDMRVAEAINERVSLIEQEANVIKSLNP